MELDYESCKCLFYLLALTAIIVWGYSKPTGRLLKAFREGLHSKDKKE